MLAMNFNENNGKLLNVWQTFQFKFDDTEKSVLERADAGRSLMFQVEKLFDSGNLNQQQYVAMVNYYENLYSDIVDEQDEAKGLNNFAEQSIALTTGFRNDSKNWKSSLTFESLDDFNISNVPAKDYKISEKMTHKTVTQANSTPYSVPTVAPDINNARPEKTREKYSINHQPFTSSRKQAPGFKPLFGNPNKTDDIMFGSFGKSDGLKSTSSVESNCKQRQQVNRSKDKVPANQIENEDTRDAYDSGFVTAKQQYIMNERKKKGRSADSGPSVGNYGATKKSLGYRRGPSSRFIPPVRNYDDDEGGESYQSRRDNKRPVMSRPKHNSSAEDDITDERLKGIDPKMVELINNEIMDHGPPVNWDDIAGLEFAKTVIKEIVVWPMLRPDIFKGLRGPPKGLLLFGPPGTGKTLIGKCIASQSKATFFSISASSLTSKWASEGEKMVRALFAVARCHQPAVIFIDEIDSLLSQRSDGEHESSRRIKTEFLIQLDGATSGSEDRLLVVGATNRPQEIDEAARRRMVKRLYIPLPEGEARKQIIRNLLKDQHYSLSEEDFEQLMQRSEGYSGSDMSNLCREAALGPIRSISGNIQAITPDQVRPIVFTDFEKAFRQVRASVSTQDLDLYVSWNKKFGSGH
ncbi:fidgetin 1 [Paramuricea clavata]|uniref:Fidgetin-like protein 1 n=1 Tax=Paramuricea clavata TaxID=317549 RepID=A0A6S7FJE8_PARCT|nr:fidgetin 1 [Paramuricea clavata]